MRKSLYLILLAATTLVSCKKLQSTNSTTNTVTVTIPTLTPTTFAGGGNMVSTDGTGTSAQFYAITKLTIDKAGNLYVVEAVTSTDNHLYFKIRKVTTAGATSTLYTSGYETFVNNVPVQKSKVYTINDMAADPNGNLYVLASMIDYSTVSNTSQYYYQETGVYKLNTTTGVLDIVSVSSTTSTGSTTSWAAPYNLLNNIAVDASGNIYGAYSPGNATGIPSGGKIYKIITGTGSLYGTADAIYPSTLVGDAAGILYASTPTNILKVTALGSSPFFTFPTSTTAVNPRLVANQSGTLYAYGDLFDSAKVYKGTGFYKVNADGNIGTKGIISNSPNLFGVVIDTSGNIFYAVHLSTGGYVIYKVTLN